MCALCWPITGNLPVLQGSMHVALVSCRACRSFGMLWRHHRATAGACAQCAGPPQDLQVISKAPCVVVLASCLFCRAACMLRWCHAGSAGALACFGGTIERLQEHARSVLAHHRICKAACARILYTSQRTCHSREAFANGYHLAVQHANTPTHSSIYVLHLLQRGYAFHRGCYCGRRQQWFRSPLRTTVYQSVQASRPRCCWLTLV
jgi:hypothetical protein